MTILFIITLSLAIFLSSVLIACYVSPKFLEWLDDKLEPVREYFYKGEEDND